MLRKFKGQSTLEYALIVAVVVGGLIAMQIYMKRGVQGKLRESTDQIGEQFDAEKTTVSRTTTRTGSTVQEVKAGVTTSYTGSADSTGSSVQGSAETRTETGSETVAAW
jgi:Flp pilus assembly pilin Flp